MNMLLNDSSTNYPFLGLISHNKWGIIYLPNFYIVLLFSYFENQRNNIPAKYKWELTDMLSFTRVTKTGINIVLHILFLTQKL